MSIDALHAALDTAIADGMPADLKAAGWVYRDFPRGVWLSTARWQEFLRIMGEGNYQILTETSVGSADARMHRGQLLIGPQGIANLAARGRAAAH